MSARMASWRWWRFVAVWTPQTLALTGRGLTAFALGVWVYEQTHSATLFALLEVSAIVPGIVAAPLVGWAVDWLGARRALILADTTAVITVLTLVTVFAEGAASPALLYFILTASAILTCLSWPAYTALVTTVAPAGTVARAGALMQLGYVGQTVVAPAVAGILLAKIGVAGVIGVDLVLSAAALASILLLEIQTPAIRRTRVWHDVREAWNVIRDRGLLRLAAYIIASYLPGGFVVALATPLVLTVAGPAALGLVMAAMGIGMLAGNLTASALARSEGGISRLLRYDALLAIAMLGAVAATTTAGIAVIGFLFLFGLGGLIAEEHAVWQVRVPADVQGRVFALRRAVTLASLPVSYAIAGPLADRVFIPAMSSGGALVNWLGPLIGTGPGRGIALLLMCGGLAKTAVILSGARDRKLRRLDALA